MGGISAAMTPSWAGPGASCTLKSTLEELIRQRLALCWRTMPAEPAHLYLCVLRLGVVQLQVRVW